MFVCVITHKNDNTARELYMNKLTSGAYGESEKAKHAIFRITALAMSDKANITTYRALLAEIGIRATGEAQKLELIENTIKPKENNK